MNVDVNWRLELFSSTVIFSEPTNNSKTGAESSTMHILIGSMCSILHARSGCVAAACS